MQLRGQLGQCGHRQVFCGFAPACDLVKLSFADVLDEASGKGYQRRFSREHSLEFKRYIHSPGATSIPLTFNLRQEASANWTLRNLDTGWVELNVADGVAPVLSQVDGQHRLGFLHDSPIPFPFMTFIGLSVAEEMEVFRTINGKARGLSSSLLDLTEAKLLGNDLPRVNPDLFVALRLHEDPRSPWYQKLDLGGDKTVGMKRIASLRTMQMAVRRFVRAAQWPNPMDPSYVVDLVIDFWIAVSMVLPTQWSAPRKHMLVKGIGVYALMSLGGLLVREAEAAGRAVSLDYLIAKLSDFLDQVDWTNEGALQGFGGGSGAEAALAMLIETRRAALTRFKLLA